ncbi:MAG: uroporphyrinogen decarboxylase family protein [Spirochaetota bacterium]
MNKNRMTMDERMAAVLNREPVDGVPFVHKGYGFCAKNYGVKKSDIYKDPEISFKAQYYTMEQYGAVKQPFYTFVSYGALEFGGEIEWPAEDSHSSSPSVKRRPVQEPEDVFKLKLSDPKKAGCVPMMMNFAKLQEKNNTQIAFICGSAFTHAANLCGVDKFMLWLITNPEAVAKALELMSDHILQVAKYFVDTFGEGRVLARCAAPTESNMLISPDQFEQYVLPVHQKVYGGVLEMGAKKNLYFHICSDHNKNLRHWQKIPRSRDGVPGILSIGHEITLQKMAEHFPDDIIAGNIEPRLVATGTPEEVYAASKKCILEGKKHCQPGRFIFEAGCELPYDVPPVNIYMMQKAVQDFGSYD